jgi:V-type H+-transporting ATPase subunit a
LLKVSENITAWTTIVRKEKAIYHTMNLFNRDINRKCLIAEGWVPSNDMFLVQQSLKDAVVSKFAFYVYNAGY